MMVFVVVSSLTLVRSKANESISVFKILFYIFGFYSFSNIALNHFKEVCNMYIYTR